MARIAAPLGCLVALVLSAPAQTPTSDSVTPTEQTNSSSQALALAAQTIQALTGGVSVADATFSGTALWFAGSTNDRGTVTLKAKREGESRINLALSSHTFSETRNNVSSDPQCWSAQAAGSYQPVAVHNCYKSPRWKEI